MPPSLRTGLEPTKQQGNLGRTQQIALRASWDLGSRQWSSNSGRGHEYTFCTSFLPGKFPLSPGYLVSDVIHHDDAMSTPVVAGRDGTEPLLPGRVPLQDSRAGMRWAWARGHPVPRRDLGGAALTICSLMVLPSNSMVRILKSTPMVLI